MLYPKQFIFVLVYTIVVMGLFCVPSYFAISSTISEEKYKATQEILEWVEVNEASIFKGNGEYVPKSVRFKINIYNYLHEEVYADIKKTFDDFNFKAKVIYPHLYYQKEVKLQNGELFYLVVELKINYAKIIFVTTILFFIVLFLVFLMSSLFVNSSIHPYRKMQQYMNDFFNDAMHELKTPLGVININLELLSKYVTEPRHIQRIKAATKQMQMTYEDVEYYIKHKKSKYNKETINLSEYLNSRVLFFEDIAISKSIQLIKDIEDDFIVYVNKVEIQRIIDNTLSNAIKYSFYKGQVEISLKSKGENSCVLSFKDYGQGIKDIYAVFNRFEREDAVQGGFGLGLNIVKNICNKNDIDIDIKSMENKGSTFYYTFKLDKKKLLDRVETEKEKGLK